MNKQFLSYVNILFFYRNLKCKKTFGPPFTFYNQYISPGGTMRGKWSWELSR